MELELKIKPTEIKPRFKEKNLPTKAGQSSDTEGGRSQTQQNAARQEADKLDLIRLPHVVIFILILLYKKKSTQDKMETEQPIVGGKASKPQKKVETVTFS